MSIRRSWDVVLGFPSLGVWGALLVWGGWALPWGVGPAGRWVRALGKYLDPAGNGDRYCLPRSPGQPQHLKYQNRI